MTKILIGVLSLALLGTGVLVGVAGGLDSEPVRSVSLPGGTTGHDATPVGTTTTGATTFGVATGTTATAATTTLGGDVSGPCDEAEHRNDPRCTGGDDDREDNSGSRSGDDRNEDDHDDDRSGSNSGSG